MINAVIFGCAGPRLEAEEAAFFRETQPLGFILFARNIVDPDQEAPVCGARRAVREHRAIGMAQMKLARRTRREARQHGNPGDSICCAVPKRIIPYLADISPLTPESDTSCNDGVTQGRQWRAIPRRNGGSVTKPCSIPILPGIPIPVRLSSSTQTIRR